MTKIFLHRIAFILTFCLTSFCFSSLSLSESILDKVIENKEINIGTREAAPPYAYIDAQGNWTGFSVEMSKAIVDVISKKVGVELNAKLNPAGVDELHKCIKFMEQYKDGETEKQFQGFSDFEIKKIQRLIDWIEAPTNFNKPRAMKNFYRFFIEHDQRRKTNLLNTFPEMENFWEECKWIE